MKVNSGIKVLKLIFLIVWSMRLAAQEKPNILIIMTDELSAESMSFNLGNQYINTPNIDQLAKTGVVSQMLIVPILFVFHHAVLFLREGIHTKLEYSPMKKRR